MEKRQHKYGDERRKWHPDFVAYAEMIVRHPAYRGMPDAIDEQGQIRWNAPSNRPPGRWQDLHDRRLRWWEIRAGELGVSRDQRGWASIVAKQIHPTGEKPCQTCGRVLSLRYVYPTKKSLKQLNRVLPEGRQLDYGSFLPIFEIVPAVLTEAGRTGYEVLERIFPELEGTSRNPDAFLQAFEGRIVPSEPKGRLSPGAMSNAPDRLDGFHSYNLCCRHKEDTGRAKDNLRSYADDRRAFEHWCEGDWASANLLMTKAEKGLCPICGRTDQLTADHIGPISLGFCHIPLFNVMCRGCNSTKGNRLTYDDIKWLIEAGDGGTRVISWHAEELWNRCRAKVKTEKDAIRLGKLLRINQHHYLAILHYVLSQGYPDVLLHLINPEGAQARIEFIGLDANTLTYKGIRRHERADTYARSKAARMIRIAFEALQLYGGKPRRNIQAVPAEELTAELKLLNKALLEEFYASAGTNHAQFRQELGKILADHAGPGQKDMRIQAFFQGRPYKPERNHGENLACLRTYMARVGCELAARF